MTMIYDEIDMDQSRVTDELMRAMWLGLAGQPLVLRRHLERAHKAWEKPYPMFAKRLRALLNQPAPSLATRDLDQAPAAPMGAADIEPPQDLLQVVTAPKLP